MRSFDFFQFIREVMPCFLDRLRIQTGFADDEKAQNSAPKTAAEAGLPLAGPGQVAAADGRQVWRRGRFRAGG